MMLNLIITGLFLVSMAIAAGSIMIASQLRALYRIDSLSTLLYMQVFYFMFGFYSLWGQVIIISYITPLVGQATLDKINEITVLLGSPFIVFGWLMLLRLINELTGRKTGKAFHTLFLLLNLAFLVTVGLLNSKLAIMKTLDILKFYFLISSIIYAAFSAIWLITCRGKQTLLSFPKRRNLSMGIALFTAAQNATLFFYDSNLLIALIFIFLFFSGTAYLPVFLKYNLEFSDKPKLAVSLSFNDFCTKYEISPREKEIIWEICNGLSNQQIADKLFISLQTVKDHTHRIYGKTMATSRMQLMKMVQDVYVK